MRQNNFLWFLATSGVLIGQSPIREFPERGSVPTGSYSVSQIESISNTTGNVSLSIPLAAMPAGPVQGLASIGLVYNSSLLNVVQLKSLRGPLPEKNIILSEEGGWNYSFGYGIRRISRIPGSFNCPDAAFDAFVTHPTKLVLLTPDGGTKDLNRRGEPDRSDGFHEVSPEGTKNIICNPQNNPIQIVNASGVPGLQRYYTTDGSYLRLDLYAAGVNSNYTAQPWTLYFPDGSRVEGMGEKTLKIADRNGKSVSFNSTLNLLTQTGSLTIQEDQAPGRTISLQLRTAENSTTGAITDTVTWPGFQENISATVTWNGGVTAPILEYICDENFPTVTCSVPGFRSAITEIKIPKATATDPDLKYLFEYRDNAHCGTPSYCRGELGKITLPSGNSADVLSTSYEYASESGSVLTPDALENPVKKRTVAYKEKTITTGTTGTLAVGSTDRSEVTNYVFDDTSSEITGPDGGVTKHYFNNPKTMTSPYRGLVFRTEKPDGSQVERLW